MLKERKSFFERFTGAMRVPDDVLSEDDEQMELVESDIDSMDSENFGSEGQLMVDVYQTHGEIVIKAMVPGVRPEDLDITITRDMVTIKGKRETERTISDKDYVFKELYWGTFSRSIALPQEIQIEDAEAVEKHGLLIIRLPKLDKNRQTKVRVRNNS